MPLYESRQNAENRIKIPRKAAESVVIGLTAVAERIVDNAANISRAKGGEARLAFDGWYGVAWGAVLDAIGRAAARAGVAVATVSTNEMAREPAEIDRYKGPFITDDPGFGYVNDKGRLTDLMSPERIRETKSRLVAPAKAPRSPSVTIVYGPGAAIAALERLYDLTLYFDFTRQPLLWQMWDGKLVPYGSDTPRKEYSWKEYYYCDFYLLEEQKNRLLGRMDYYVEAVDVNESKLVPRDTYDQIMSTLVTYPIKEVKIFQPGPWGAYRYKDLWDIPGLECNAWNELAGPELSILVDIGREKMLNMPVTNLMQYPEQFVGPRIHKDLPGMFPLDVWLDDGYFPGPTPAERISMPIHNHPSTEYVKRHHNEPLGRYETYYICEAYEGANTWMGFLEDADLESWEHKCRESERTGKPIKDWKKFVANHDSNVGDLYLIPPGTTHGHGGNQMILEMDTVPSIAGTEYSFFMYDFCRPSWDDSTKTMTGKPVMMHLDHGFNMDQARRREWVSKHLRATPKIVKWTKEYSMDRYSSHGPMPFEIERFHFYKRADNDTGGRFMHVVTLTIGERVLIRSLDDPARSTEIERFQSAVVPACFGKYEFVNMTAGQCTVAQLRWKNG